MVILKTRCKPFSVNEPYRPKRPESDKIIFLSCEGCVTEEEYFYIVMEVFEKYKSKIQFISVAEDEVHTAVKFRTSEQVDTLS